MEALTQEVSQEQEVVTIKQETVVITPPNFQIAELEIVGTAPYVQNKFSAKARGEIKAKQAKGSTAKAGKKHSPKDFGELYKQAMHISSENWHGIPAPAFRAALIDACRLVGFKMTLAKQAIFILQEGVDKDDGTPLVKITEGSPKPFESYVRLPTGVPDIRERPMWEKWAAIVRIQFDDDVFTLEDVTNLLARAGGQVGIGEGRPFSKKSHGMGWGTFEVRQK